MKFKFPKYIDIGDTRFHITYDYKNDDGASFQYPSKGKKAYIKFGMLNHNVNKLQFLNFVIHELKEIIQIEQAARFSNNDVTGSYLFSYNHAKHSDLCCRLSELLTHFIV